MGRQRTTFKPKTVPDDAADRLLYAYNHFEVCATAAGFSKEQYDRLKGILNDWSEKTQEMTALGVNPTKRDYRLFMLKRLDVY
jgi:hypothetical protein